MQDLVLQKNLTFLERLETLRSVNTQRHYDDALGARVEFESMVVQAVRARVHQVLSAIAFD